MFEAYTVLTYRTFDLKLE